MKLCTVTCSLAVLVPGNALNGYACWGTHNLHLTAQWHSTLKKRQKSSLHNDRGLNGTRRHHIPYLVQHVLRGGLDKNCLVSARSDKKTQHGRLILFWDIHHSQRFCQTEMSARISLTSSGAEWAKVYSFSFFLQYFCLPDLEWGANTPWVFTSRFYDYTPSEIRILEAM